jgi:peptide/nickel transport system substrate-binding protein
MATLGRLRVCLLAGGLLAACSHVPAPAAGPLIIVQTQPVELPVPGRENGAVAAEMAALLHRSLVTVDVAGRLVPDAAREVPNRANGGISPDGLTISYHLKPGLRFSDGTPLGAADVVATLNALRAPGARIASRLGLDDVVGAVARAPLEVQVRLARPYAPILLYLCGPGNATSILPAATASAIETSATPPQAIGAGPYRIKTFQAGERLELERNPWYQPVPLVPALVIRTVASSSTAHVQLHSGEANGYLMADPSLEPMLADVPGLRTDATPVDGIGGLIFNTTAGPVNTPATRLAIVDALDIAGTVRRVFHGGVSAHDAPAGLFLWAYDPHAFPPPVYSPKAAAALLDAQGWRAGDDGKRYRNGVPLELTLIVRGDQPSSSALAATFAQQLRNIGIAVATRQYAIQEWGSPDGPLYRGRFDLAIAQFIAGPDPDLTDQFACDRIPPRGYNKPRYCNPQLDDVLARANATYVVPQRIALYRKAQQILARDIPMMPLYRLVALNAMPAALRGFNPTPITPFYDVAAWDLTIHP